MFAVLPDQLLGLFGLRDPQAKITTLLACNVAWSGIARASSRTSNRPADPTHRMNAESCSPRQR
jgi:hypothetical protein